MSHTSFYTDTTTEDGGPGSIKSGSGGETIARSSSRNLFRRNGLLRNGFINSTQVYKRLLQLDTALWVLVVIYGIGLIIFIVRPALFLMQGIILNIPPPKEFMTTNYFMVFSKLLLIYIIMVYVVHQINSSIGNFIFTIYTIFIIVVSLTIIIELLIYVSQANTIQNPNNPANSELYCCYYGSQVPECQSINFSPPKCGVGSIKALLVNGTFIEYFIWVGFFFIFEITLSIIQYLYIDTINKIQILEKKIKNGSLKEVSIEESTNEPKMNIAVKNQYHQSSFLNIGDKFSIQTKNPKFTPPIIPMPSINTNRQNQDSGKARGEPSQEKMNFRGKLTTDNNSSPQQREYNNDMGGAHTSWLRHDNFASKNNYLHEQPHYGHYHVIHDIFRFVSDKIVNNISNVEKRLLTYFTSIPLKKNKSPFLKNNTSGPPFKKREFKII
jgi:hypothetical protein